MKFADWWFFFTDWEEVWPDEEAAEEVGQGILWTVWESRGCSSGVGVQCCQGQAQKVKVMHRMACSLLGWLFGGTPYG